MVIEKYTKPKNLVKRGKERYGKAMKTLKDIFSSNLSPQEMQDEIFRNMSVDQKITLWAQLWSFGKGIQEGKVKYSLERLEKPAFEDLILAKLRWHRMTPSSRQLEDVESVFKISGDKLDKEYLAKWAKTLGLSDLLSPLLKNKKDT